ncbi:PorP/SprF family type IX secretion system membrane protein [Sunxiuqinia elliptica]
MIKKLKYLFCLLLFIGNVLFLNAQEMMHLQSVVKQEFINPAYNSFKDYSSINLISRLQWVNLPHNPEVYGVNVFVPFRVNRLGMNVTLMRENIGLRKVSSADVSLSTNIRLNKQSFLAFGYGIGLKSNIYRTDEIISYDDGSYLFGNENWNTHKFTTKFGAFYMDEYMFAGFSGNMLVDRKWNDHLVLCPSWDFIIGAMYKINRNLLFRPDFVVKYYRTEVIEMAGGVEDASYVPPVFDPAINFFIHNRIWAGISYRINMAATISLSVKANDNLRFGYTYEYGIGEGVNQFSSHGFTMTFDFNQKVSLYNHQRNARMRHNIGDVVNRNYLYR